MYCDAFSRCLRYEYYHPYESSIRDIFSSSSTITRRTMFNIVIRPNEITSCFITVCIRVFVPLSRRCITNGLAMLVLMFVLNRSGTFKVNSSNAIFTNIVNSTVRLCNYFSIFDKTSKYFSHPLPKDVNIKS